MGLARRPPSCPTMPNSNVAPSADDASGEHLSPWNDTSDDRLWEQLPDLVLVHLFSFLSSKDRVSAGLVCARWFSALHSPVLWRNMQVVLCSPSGEERLAAMFLRRYGNHVRCLELRWSRRVRGGHAIISSTRNRRTLGTSTTVGDRSTLMNQRGAIESVLGLLAQLEALRAQVQVRKLSLVDWVLSYKWSNHRARLLVGLANFLGSQRRLEVLSIQNGCLGVAEVHRLLAAAARGVPHGSDFHLQDLRLAAAFREWQAPHSSPRLLRTLRRLGPLKFLRLDYPVVSDATLRLLAESCTGHLQHLAVTVRDTDYRQHTISDDAWANLVNACPKIRVFLNVENMAHHDDIINLLVPSMPLSSFRLYSGPVWDQSRSRDFRSSLRLLINYYSSSLENLHLHIKNNREQLDDLLLELLTRSRRLDYFHYDGVLRHIDTVRDICQLRLESAINFQTIHVRPRNLNKINRTIVKDISRDYEDPLSAQAVDFNIEDPSLTIPVS